jgi:hypothetical protein
MTQAPGDVTGNESRRRPIAVQTIRDTGSASTTLPGGDAVLQLKVKQLQHAELGAVELTYAPLRPRGVADDLSVVV